MHSFMHLHVRLYSMVAFVWMYACERLPGMLLHVCFVNMEKEHRCWCDQH